MRPMQTVDQKIFPSETPVFREGDPGNAAYIVKKGRVEIWKMEDGERRVLGEIGRAGFLARWRWSTTNPVWPPPPPLNRRPA
ncbi:MAG: CRP-like cAMP-binding protein [Alphaproteobacteria bacterium]|jgi:CRP-like cAMP-binding protein